MSFSYASWCYAVYFGMVLFGEIDRLTGEETSGDSTHGN